jgi:hypothetical protein
VDETYVKVAGRWRYVFRAVDEYGQVIDVYVSFRRDAAAARRFFDRALATAVVEPGEVVTDRAVAYLGVLEHRPSRRTQASVIARGLHSSVKPPVPLRLVHAATGARVRARQRGDRAGQRRCDRYPRPPARQ